MLQKYYYAIGTIFKTLDSEGQVIEDCAFLTKDGEFTDKGLATAIVYPSEHDALNLAQEVNGRVVRVHHEYVEQMDIDINN